jgi:large subunit ribosomal protein L30
MIAAIRISGMVGIRGDVAEAMNRLKLRKKYACVLLEDNKINNGMLKKVRNNVAYGKISEEMLGKLIESRGKPLDKTEKVDLEKAKKLDYKGANMKPFFRLHPPRKGIKSKIHYPKGVLGDNGEDINKLIERML